MGRPPTHGAPSFRFFHAEVAEMEALLREHGGHVPPREILMSLANKFSNSQERSGKIAVQMKQVWNWFQNRRYALRSKLVKSPGNPNMLPNTRDEVAQARNVSPVLQQAHVQSGHNVARNTSENPPMEFEAKSARDGAWYDVQVFLSHRYLETGNPEVLVRFSGFGSEEDEWIIVRKHVRQRSLPCESSECVAVLPGDLILCFQEGKEQALYFDAHVLDAQRRRHDVRGCRCRFLVRYDHDQTEEIVPLRKICRRPETDHRLQQLHAANESAPTSTSESKKPAVDPNLIGTMRVTNPHPSAAVTVPPPTITNVTAQTLMSAPTPALVSAPTSTPTPTPAPISAPTPSPTLTSAPSPASLSVLTPSPTLLSAPSPSSVSNRTPSPALVSAPTPSSTLFSAPSPSATSNSNSAPTSSSTPISAPLSPMPASAPSLIPVSAPALSQISDPSRSSAPLSATPPPPTSVSAPSPTLAPTSSPTSTSISASTSAPPSAPSLSAVVAPVSTPTTAPIPIPFHIPVSASESRRLESDDSGTSLVGASVQDKIINSGAIDIVVEAKKEGVHSDPQTSMVTEGSAPQEEMSDKPTVPVPEPEKVGITAPSKPTMAVGASTTDGGLVLTETSNPTVLDTKE